MAAASVPPKQVFSPGLLLTHDWRQLHTPCGLLDTTIKEVPASSSYQTVTFPITNALQFDAFVNGLGRCDVDAKKNCPLQLVPGYDSKNAGDCSERPLSAMVRMTYKVTHTLSETLGDSSLSDSVIEKLIDLENPVEGGDVPKDDIIQFLYKFGSHFPKGVQRLGKCFTWMVVVERECDIDLLREIAKEILVTCDKHDRHIPGSHEGIWYSLHNVVNCESWSDEKKKLLQSARLRVAHHGNIRNVMCFTEWTGYDSVKRPVKVDPMSDALVGVWDLIEQSQLKFQVHKKLASMVKAEWTQLAEGSQHSSSAPIKISRINIPIVCWTTLLDDLAMKNYYPAEITLQKVRSLHKQKEATSKTDLPWKVLHQMILLNSMCREEDISKFAKRTKKVQTSIIEVINQVRSLTPSDKSEAIPHPMDLTLLIFMCSDFMLRQVLAKKLFMCCLAIPFIVPTPEDTVEILMWPLRSIVLEWRDKQEAKEEALVTCKVNMVAFIRFRHTKLSKSKLMNTILSSSSHEIFCHKDTPCGGEKRQISNGTVEMSHFLPSASKSDQFSLPALFFNLRGDACDYPVQHSLLMELATVLVLFLDLQEMQTKQVQALLHETVNTKDRIVVVLTDSKGHTDEDFVKLLENLCKQLGDTIEKIKIVVTFEENGNDKNATQVIQDVREMITGMMLRDPPCSLEDFAALTKTCPVDETTHQHCKAGKRVADKILSEMQKVTIKAGKTNFLPQQGQYLRETGKLLRKLHRSPGGENASGEGDVKEKIMSHLKAIKKRQASESRGNDFMKKVIAMFHEPTETKRFAMRWFQIDLDAISRTVLPKLRSEKNRKWKELMKAQDDMTDSLPSLEKEISALEKQIDDATFGMEHVMREMAQLYDVAAYLKQAQTESEYDFSSLPDIVSQLLLEGQPVELMDGDHGFIPLEWMKAVFRSLAKLVGEKKIFVLSVMGIQSSGKSTLLNTMFGLEFAVSAGRCTRGIYAQLLPVTDGSGLPFDFMLVLDSEGLRAQQLGHHNYEHDNELATLVIGLSDLALINMKGENVMEVTDILLIVVLAFLRMKLANATPKKQCMFIHQNVSAVNTAEKLAEDQQKFQELLNKLTQQAAESQGLHQTITSFNHVISFDGEQDMVCFTDLWKGDPPMAPVNQGYSTRAAETQQRILREVSQKCKNFLTVSEFIFRIEDMWNGVLADDFIFNFRNSLAAKAYLDLEREFASLTMEMEQDLLQWVNITCNVQMQNCQTEPDVDAKFTKLNLSLQNREAELQAENQSKLDTFFDNHPTQEVIMQWQTEKNKSLQFIGKTIRDRMFIKLENMKKLRHAEIQQQQMSHSKEQAIMSQAIALAEGLHGNCPKEAQEEKFDEMWVPWAEEWLAASYQRTPVVTHVLYQLLWEMLKVEGSQRFLNLEFESNPVSACDPTDKFTSRDLTKDHVTAKGIVEKTASTFTSIQNKFTGVNSYLDKVADQANVMMKAVIDEVETISEQDVMFDLYHGKHIIAFALQQITQYNHQKHIPFSFTQQFRAMFVLRVVHYAALEFENMNQNFEKKHGMQKKLDSTRQRVFKQFQNAVERASTEVSKSADFCEAIKGPLIDYLRLQIKQQVVKELYQALGMTKYDLITKMLDDIIKTRDFSNMYTYVNTPVDYATQWVQKFGHGFIFGEKDGESRYQQLVCMFIEELIAKVKTSTQTATRSVIIGLESAQYKIWFNKFLEEMKETISLGAQQLELTSTAIEDFEHFQKCLEENLKNLDEILKEELCQPTAESVTWASGGNSFHRVCKRLWGCQEICPLCQEPCQYSDPHHTIAHSCIQHRPSGVSGTKDITTKLLGISTCNMNVSSEASFTCAAGNYACRKTSRCTGRTVFHPYREYKKFLPLWDIAPDPSNEATKFWKWAMCAFQGELVGKYKQTNNVAGVKIPKSWNDITEQDASDSLRTFFK